MSGAQKRLCPECGEAYWNRGAHLERCRGPVLFQTPVCDSCGGTGRVRDRDGELDDCRECRGTGGTWPIDTRGSGSGVD